MDPHTQDLIALALAAMSGMLGLILVWHAIWFARVGPECGIFSEVAGVFKYELRSDWIGRRELHLVVGDRRLRVYPGDWLPRIAQTAARNASLVVRACPTNARVWEVLDSGRLLLTVKEQVAAARTESQGEFIMAFMCAAYSSFLLYVWRRAKLTYPAT
jgi:hypothetical protein